MKMTIENAYSDGHKSELAVVFEGPAWKEPTVEEITVDGDANDGLGDYEGSFWEEHVYELTGDGHDQAGKLGYCHTATIIEADNPELVGRSYEWVGY